MPEEPSLQEQENKFQFIFKDDFSEDNDKLDQSERQM